MDIELGVMCVWVQFHVQKCLGTFLLRVLSPIFLYFIIERLSHVKVLVLPILFNGSILHLELTISTGYVDVEPVGFLTPKFRGRTPGYHFPLVCALKGKWHLANVLGLAPL